MKRKLSKTRNIILLCAIVSVIAYALADIVLAYLSAKASTYSVMQFDSTLTQEWFGFWKWVVTTGATITVAKTLKGKTNSDNEEIGSGEE